MSSPSSRMAPSLGVSKPASMRSSVVLPQPEGPSSEKNSRLKMSRETLSTATKSPKLLVTPTICTCGFSLGSFHGAQRWRAAELPLRVAAPKLPASLMPFIPRSSSRRPGPQPSPPAWPPAWQVDGPASLRRRGRVPDLVAALHLGPEAGGSPRDPRLVGRNRVERLKGGRGRIDRRIADDILLQKFL